MDLEIAAWYKGWERAPAGIMGSLAEASVRDGCLSQTSDVREGFLGRGGGAAYLNGRVNEVESMR